MERKVTIYGSFGSLNEYIKRCGEFNGRWNKGSAMKAQDQECIQAQLPRMRFQKPVTLDYVYYCRNRKVDLDNIAGYFHKIFQDALVKRGVIANDGWRHVVGFSDTFYVDRRDPRIEVTIREAEG